MHHHDWPERVPTDPRSRLIDALVADRRLLYDTSAVFRRSIDSLAALLLPWVSALAAEAEGRERDATAEFERLTGVREKP